MYLNNFNKEVILMVLNCTNVKKTNYINNKLFNKTNEPMFELKRESSLS